jgi:hypothetical protein
MFVTDTRVGPVLCREFLSIDDGLIRSGALIFDWRRWPEVQHELQARTPVAAQRSPRTLDQNCCPVPPGVPHSERRGAAA